MRHVLPLALLLAAAPALADEKGSHHEKAREGHEAPEAGEAGEAQEAAPSRPGDWLPGDVSGEGKPPPGSPEDQALWSEAAGLNHRITLSRTTATKLQWQARNDGYEEKLAARAKKAQGEEAARLAELRKLYRSALSTNYLTLTRRWPVDPTRGCQYAMLHLGSAMREGKPELLAPSRDDVRICVGKARPAVEVMETSNGDLERMAAEAARALGAAAAAAPAEARGEKAP